MTTITTIPRLTFDRKFQAKLIRALYQHPDEGREVLLRIEPSVFDTQPMQWTVRKMKESLVHTGAPATSTVIEYEAQRDVQLGVIKASYVDAYASFLASLSKPVPEKSFVLDKAHEYVRYVIGRDFLIKWAGSFQDPAKIDWSKFNKELDYQRIFGERSAGGLGMNYFEDIDARTERRKNFEKNGVPTGTAIDTHLRHGGLPPKQLGVIMAPPGRGKTAVLVYFSGSAVMAGKNVLYVSLELDEDMIGERHDSRFSRVSLSHLSKVPKKTTERLKAVMQKYSGRLWVKEFPSGTLTVAGLRAFLKRLEGVPFYPNLIVIDYADNMSLAEFGGKDSDSEYSPLGRLYVALRGLAGEFLVPIWTASQSNRMSLDKETLGMGDLADSFKKAAVSDVMVGVGQTEEEHLKRVARFIMIKNRNGVTGVVDPIVFDTRRVQITDL